MNFDLTEEQKDIIKAARELLRKSSKTWPRNAIAKRNLQTSLGKGL